MFGHSQAMNTTSPENIDQLLNWKQTRKNVFGASVSIPKNFSLAKVVDYHGSDEDINIQPDPELERNENETVDDVTENEHTRDKSQSKTFSTVIWLSHLSIYVIKLYLRWVEVNYVNIQISKLSWIMYIWH